MFKKRKFFETVSFWRRYAGDPTTYPSPELCPVYECITFTRYSSGKDNIAVIEDIFDVYGYVNDGGDMTSTDEYVIEGGQYNKIGTTKGFKNTHEETYRINKCGAFVYINGVRYAIEITTTKNTSL